MGEEWRILVRALSGEPLEPGSEAGVQARAPCARQACIRDLARECVLDRVLALPWDRRSSAQADEVPLLQRPEIGLGGEQFVDRAGPEDASDDGGGLKGFLVDGVEKIDTGCQESLDRVGNLHLGGGFTHCPPAVLAGE